MFPFAGRPLTTMHMLRRVRKPGDMRQLPFEKAHSLRNTPCGSPEKIMKTPITYPSNDELSVNLLTSRRIQQFVSLISVSFIRVIEGGNRLYFD